jgi:hypothetical protein
MTESCRACGRPLRDPESVATGVGQKCATRVQPPSEIMFRAEWFSEVVGGVLVLFDRDCGSMSLTNDAERVLAEEALRRGAAMPTTVIYRDSAGRYDRLRHRGGVFGGFSPIGAASLDEALSMIAREASAA